MVIRPDDFLPHVKLHNVQKHMVCENYPGCDCYCKVIPKGSQVRCISTPANRKLRALRKEAHFYLQQLLDNGIYQDVNEAYQYLSTINGTDILGNAHIGTMEEYGCKKTIRSLIEILHNNRDRVKKFRPYVGWADKEESLQTYLSDICIMPKKSQTEHTENTERMETDDHNQ
jgi:hypothetical protein